MKLGVSHLFFLLRHFGTSGMATGRVLMPPAILRYIFSLYYNGQTAFNQIINLLSSVTLPAILYLSLFFFTEFRILWKYFIVTFCLLMSPQIYVRCIVKVAQLCPTLCDPMDHTVLGILQARILEWVAIPSSKGSSQPRDQTQVSRIAGRFFTTRECTHEVCTRKVNKALELFCSCLLVYPWCQGLTCTWCFVLRSYRCVQSDTAVSGCQDCNSRPSPRATGSLLQDTNLYLILC